MEGDNCLTNIKKSIIVFEKKKGARKSIIMLTKKIFTFKNILKNKIVKDDGEK